MCTIEYPVKENVWLDSKTWYIIIFFFFIKIMDTINHMYANLLEKSISLHEITEQRMTRVYLFIILIIKKRTENKFYLKTMFLF